MSRIIYEHAGKSYGSHLRTGEWKQGYRSAFRSSHYYGDHLTIQTEEERASGQIPEHTSLITNYNGKRYQRNYDKVFDSDHSVKMICARFQKDILTNKIKPYATKRQNKTNTKR